MTGAPEPLDDLVSHAHQTRVVVVGGGVAGLVAALECAKVGMRVTVVEAARRLGGTISGVEIAGLSVDAGATCWSARGAAVRELVDELGLADRVVEPATDATWIAGLPRGAAAPAPRDAVLGIPANPWDDAARRIIGWGGAWRAYLDRLRPPLTIGKQRNLARLVRSRMGHAVLERLVAPLSTGGFGVAPDRIDVVAAAPGLTTALTRTGSLGGAVADVLVDRPAGASVESLAGGMRQLVDAIAARLALLGAEILTGTEVTGLSPDGARWRVDHAPSVPELDPSAGGSDRADAEPAPSDAGPAPWGPDPLFADVVVVATGESAARRLLGLRAAEPGPLVREVVTLVVDAPGLDAAPRGAQVFAVPGTARASGLVHQTARWEPLARAAGAGTHVLGVAFDGRGAEHPSLALADAEAFALAVAEASALLGAPIDAPRVRGAHREAFELAPPASVLGHDVSTSSARALIAARPGLAAVGAWLAGSGLAQVVPDAQREADRLRRAVLWGGPENP